jgi:hypothetical protein
MLPDVMLYGVIYSLLTKVFLASLHMCIAGFGVSGVESCNYTTTVLAAYTHARRTDNKYVFGSERCLFFRYKVGYATTNSFYLENQDATTNT